MLRPGYFSCEKACTKAVMVSSLCVDPHRTTGEVLRAVMVTTDCQPKGLSGLSQETHLWTRLRGDFDTGLTKQRRPY